MPKNILYHVILSLAIITLAACSEIDPNSQIDEGSFSDDTYTSNEIGWTMRIPKGWTILPLDEASSYQERGKEAIEGTIGDEVSIEGTKNLLNLRKNRFNIFQSTSQPFELKYEGEWEETNEALKQVLIDTYSSKGMHPVATETTTDRIDGVAFDTYEITLSTPDGKEFIRQLSYSTLVHGYDFGINITYNDKQARDEIVSAWKESVFTKKR